jgi:hypothetical protein
MLMLGVMLLLASGANERRPADLPECMGDMPWDTVQQYAALIKRLGECCGRYTEDKDCVEFAEECEFLEINRDEIIARGGVGEYGMPIKKYIEMVYDPGCNAYCKRAHEDWCPEGLSGGAIAGIVIACILVVAAGVGGAVYFFVIKPKRDANSAAAEDKPPLDA